MKYKVGDKVMVRGDLEVGKRYGITMFTSEKAKHKGKILEIFNMLKKDGAYQYRLADSSWYSPEMLRPVEFKIWCETKEEKQAVLEKLEKEGYVWKSGEKPTELTYSDFLSKNPRGLCISDNKLSWENSKQRFNSNNLPKITPSEFTGINFSEKIIITKTPTGATATYGDKTVTTEGDFEDASRQALVEVLCPFEVGDRVKDKATKRIGTVEKIYCENHIIVDCKTSGFESDYPDFGKLEPYTEPSYNAKLFCIRGSGRVKGFERGYIYEVKDGKFTDSNVDVGKFKNLEEINSKLIAQFMEVKGGLDE